MSFSRLSARAVALAAGAAVVWFVGIPACSSDSGGGISNEDNAASECAKMGAKCYTTTGGCPGGTEQQAWQCPQIVGTPNRCCSVKDAGSGG